MKRVRAYAMVVVADVIMDRGLLPLREAHDIFVSSIKEEITETEKRPKFEYKSGDVRDLFQRNLPVILVYGSASSYLVRKSNTLDWDSLMSDIEWPGRDLIVKETVSTRLKELLPAAMKYASTAKDRHLLKVVLTSITSVSYMSSGKVGIKCSKKSLKCSNIQSVGNIRKYMEMSKDKELSQYTLQKKKSELPHRLPGSGRLSFIDLYPELSQIMLSLFDSCSEGFSAHPRLICDTLFLEKQGWLDMPRCVSILQQVFGIPITLSTAYTYTDNFKRGTRQAKRHHESINPGISLRISTQDGQSILP